MTGNGTTRRRVLAAVAALGLLAIVLLRKTGSGGGGGGAEPAAAQWQGEQQASMEGDGGARGARSDAGAAIESAAGAAANRAAARKKVQEKAAHDAMIAEKEAALAHILQRAEEAKAEAAKKADLPWGGNAVTATSTPQECDWATYRVGQESADMCVHPQSDIVSNSIRGEKQWKDCDILRQIWVGKDKNEQEGKTFIDIGANIGSCVMHMMLSTKVKSIIAFEPNPANLFCLTSTLMRLAPKQRQRVTLYPFALGEKAMESKIFSATHNMGNSVVGKMVLDPLWRPEQSVNQGVPIWVQRYDVVIAADVPVGLLKMDAQGFECSVCRGMGTRQIEIIKLEVNDNWLSAHPGCSDAILFELLHAREMDITSETGEVLKKPKRGNRLGFDKRLIKQEYEVVARMRQLAN